jgi:hypothetical protein
MPNPIAMPFPPRPVALPSAQAHDDDREIERVKQAIGDLLFAAGLECVE